MMPPAVLLVLVLVLSTCERAPLPPTEAAPAFPIDVPQAPAPPPPAAPAIDYDTSEWTELNRLVPGVELEIRYASTNNFMEQRIYDCGRCFYRPPVAAALASVQRELEARGLGLKLFDCYRPQPYQQRLWDVLPDARYVANPARGSLHSRGAAADLTLINLDTGVELDMGTPYDYFGEEAYTTTTDLPPHVLQNRALLQDVMARNTFAAIRTEWWHFNFLGPRQPLSEWVWACP